MFRPGPISTGYALMDQATPWPVKSPYAMRPDMTALEDRPILAEDRRWHEYIEQKLIYGSPVYARDWDPDIMIKVIAKLAQLVPKGPVQLSENNLIWPWISSHGDQNLMQFLTMSLQEDFVVWTRNSRGELAAQALSVCFPSGWDPREKVGMTFAEIHEPLADADLIKQASNHIAQMICTRGPFLRYVWSISNTGGLSRRPDLIPPWTNQGLDDMWFRAERQVTVPIDQDTALFLIRVYVTPLKRIIEFQDKALALKASINSMSDAVIEYKGFGYVREWINQHVA